MGIFTYIKNKIRDFEAHLDDNRDDYFVRYNKEHEAEEHETMFDNTKYHECRDNYFNTHTNHTALNTERTQDV